MKTLIASQGQTIVVDDKDFARLNQWKWRVNKNGYAHHGIWRDGKLSQIRLHRMILEVTDPKIDVDHLNGNKLDNRRSNLRLCSRSQNMANTFSKQGSSAYKGVSWSKAAKRWRARLMKDYKEIYHQLFDSELEAARAYNAKAVEVFGEFARLNEV